MCIEALARFPTPQAAAVEAIIGAPLAWSSTASLHAAGHCLCVLEALEALPDRPRGLLQRWELPEGTQWTLSPYGAHIAGVSLAQPNGVTRWSGPGAPAPTRKRPRGWNPWARKAEKPAPRTLIDEVSEMEVRLFAREASGNGEDQRPLRGGIGNAVDARRGIPVVIDPRLGRDRRNSAPSP